ncbi:MAG: serine hydrolase domain-containing protein [Imperialibacter sp.]|uniref:serine hydrolase domain-containing protein n=1 Tax=Imperialibacter sp. TaxID=2038411 RepID=UPI0032EAC1C4
MNKLIYFLLVFGCMLLTSCVGEVAPGPEVSDCNTSVYQVPNASFYDSLLREYWLETGSPGVVAMISQPGNTWAGAVGQADLENGTAMQTCHQFQIGSISKMFTAATVLLLQEDGKIDIDEKVSTYLPQLRGNIEHVDVMTVRQLLNHTAGVPDYYFMQAYILDMMNDPLSIKRSAKEALRKYNYGKKADFFPGEGWNYSNSGYVMLGWIIAEVTKKPFEAVVKEKVIDPLGLTDTYMVDFRNPRRAKNYVDLSGKGVLIESSKYDDDVIGTPEGGVVSTVQDLTAFARGLFSGGLLKAESLSEMMFVPCEPDAIDEGVCGYTLGLSYWKNTAYGDAFGHSGGEVGMESLLLYFVDHDAVGVFFRNRNGPSRKQFLFDMLMKE